MRKNFGVKPYMYPMPVLIISTYNEDGTPNAMNAAWGIICDMNKIALFLSAGHKTTKNILARKAFIVSMANAENVVEADYMGIASGNRVADKLEKAGWHTVKSEFVDAPLVEELPMALECRLDSWDEETECVVGEIVNVCADESILNEDGKVDLAKFHPICYDPVNRAYVTMGERVGTAYSDGKKIG